jgi:hypothetical protein
LHRNKQAYLAASMVPMQPICVTITCRFNKNEHLWQVRIRAKLNKKTLSTYQKGIFIFIDNNICFISLEDPKGKKEIKLPS